MRLTVRAKPGAHEERVTKTAPDEYEVAVRERPEKGRANRAVLDALARHLRVAPSRLRIVMGHTARTKVVEVV